MGAKDITEKTLEACNDVFADIVNVLLFDGEDVVSQDALAEGSPYSNYTENGKIRAQERDVYKYWNNSQIRIAAIGFENETEEEEDMPLRVINYDAAGYRAQLATDNENKHVQEMLSLMTALTDDTRFVDTYDKVKGKERVTMCTVLDVIEEKGVAKGEIKGEIKGTIRTSQRLGSSYEDTVKLITDEFNLSEEDAEESVKLYWK